MTFEKPMETPGDCGVLPLINQSVLRSNAPLPRKKKKKKLGAQQLLGIVGAVRHICYVFPLIMFFVFNNVVGDEVHTYLGPALSS